MPADDDSTRLPSGSPRADALVREDLCDAFEGAWRAGPPPLVEDYWARFTGPGRDDLLAELLHLDVAYRRQRGEQPVAADYLPRFPEHGSTIERVLTPETLASAAPPSTNILPSDPAQRANLQRNVLLGLVAVQWEFVPRARFAAALRHWLADPARSLAARLETEAGLTAERRELLEALVAEHLEAHAGRIEDSLAALSSLGSFRDALAELQDDRLETVLALVARAPLRGASVGPRDMPRFRILRPHAKGGLGEVYLAEDQELRRQVALKEIQARHLDNPDARARFLVEAEITGNLEHPGIVPVYGLGTYADGRPYYAMRFIHGDSLQSALEQFHAAGRTWPDAAARSLELRKLLQRFLDVCNAIDYAHSRGVLHRDLKPGNIMLGPYGETLVVDWGLAKPLSTRETPLGDGPAAFAPPSGGNSNPTQLGAAIGTPQYMSPEQAAGRIDLLGPASDVYSLGATLYTLLTGRPALTGATLGEVLECAREGRFPRPRAVDSRVPAPLEAICLRAMAVDPQARYPSPRALADDLEHWLADERVAAYREPAWERGGRWARRHRAVVSGAGALLLTAVGALAVGLYFVNAERERTEIQRVAAVQARADEAAQRRRAEAAQAAEAVQRNAADEQRRLAEQRATEALAAQAREAEQRRRAERAQAEEAAQRRLADQRRQAVEQAAYASQVQAASSAWEHDRVEAALRHLDASSEDLRGWEHAYLDHKFRRLGQVVLRGHQGEVACLAVSPDGSRLATGGSDQTVRLWNPATGECVQVLRGHAAELTCLAFSPDGLWLASGGSDHKVAVWDLARGQVVRTLAGHDAPVTDVAYVSEGSQIVSASRDRTLRFWDATSGKALRVLRDVGLLDEVAVSPDGRQVVGAGGAIGFDLGGRRAQETESTLRVWDVASGGEALKLPVQEQPIQCVAYRPDGRQFAVGEHRGPLALWDAETGARQLSFGGPRYDAWCLAYRPDGQELASSGSDGVLRVWNAATGEPRFVLRGHVGWVRAVAYLPDGQRIASASFDGTLRIWDAHTGQRDLTLPAQAGSVTSVVFSPDGKWLATGGFDRRVALWDARSGRQVRLFPEHARPIASVAFSPDGKTLVTADGGVPRLWDTATGRETVELVPAGPGTFKNVAPSMGAGRALFSRKGAMVISGDRDGSVRLWDAATGQRIFPQEFIQAPGLFPEWRTNLLAFQSSVLEWDAVVATHRDGTVVAAGYLDGWLRLWDLQTGKERQAFETGQGPVRAVAFSDAPDRPILATAGNDGTVKLWRPWLAFGNRPEPIVLRGHADAVTSIAFSPDGRRIVSGGRDGTLRVWDTATGQETFALSAHADAVTCVAFSHDGHRVASAGGDGTVCVWDGSPPATNAP